MAIQNSTDRWNGLVASLAVKAPVDAVAITNITLSGEQTVNGVAVTSGDRVLATAQTSAVDNGIYNVSSSAWSRAADFDGNRDVVKGTLVVVNASIGAYVFYQVTSNNPIVIGSSAISFATESIATSDGGTGGTGSAGAGSQYVELNINGTTYKVLHDGTV